MLSSSKKQGRRRQSHLNQHNRSSYSQGLDSQRHLLTKLPVLYSYAFIIAQKRYFSTHKNRFYENEPQFLYVFLLLPIFSQFFAVFFQYSNMSEKIDQPT